jgi:hypothetical protein
MLQEQQQFLNTIPSSSSTTTTTAVTVTAAAAAAADTINTTLGLDPFSNINNTNDNTGYGLGYHHHHHDDGPSYSTSNGMLLSSISTNTTTSKIGIDLNHNDNNSSSNSLVQSLLQQCVSYHEEQEALRRTNHTNVQKIHYNHVNDTTFITPTTNSYSSPNILPLPIVQLPIPNNSIGSTTITSVVGGVPPYFVPSSSLLSSRATAESSTSSFETKEEIQQQQQQNSIDQAKERAKLIITRFPKFHDIISNNYSIHPHPTNQTVSLPPTTSTTTTILSTTDIPPTTALTTTTPTTTSIDYIQQRQIGFQRETQRKQQAIVKNLQYIMKQQQQRIEQLTSHMIAHNASLSTTTTSSTPTTTDLTIIEQLAYKEYNDTIVQQQQQNLDQSSLNHPNRTSKKRGKYSSLSNNRTSTNHNYNNDKTAVAIYISIQQAQQQRQHQYENDAVTTTPNDSVVDTSLSQYWNESYLQSLFETYGTIRNIYFYRNKQTGLYKGDGLIVYKVIMNENDDEQNDNDNDNDKKNFITTTEGQILIDLVCGQVRSNHFFNCFVTYVFCNVMMRVCVAYPLFICPLLEITNISNR